MHRFLARPVAERRLFFRALWRVTTIRVRLTLQTFAAARKWVERIAGRNGRGLNDVAPDAIAWSVRASSRLIPGASCLTQALAAHVMLEQGGHPSTLHIGVSRQKGPFEAHAWIEYRGKVIVGEIERDDFVPLPPI